MKKDEIVLDSFGDVQIHKASHATTDTGCTISVSWMDRGEVKDGGWFLREGVISK